jgi:hypothetical protein
MTTDASGGYELPALPPGTYHVRAVPSSTWVVADSALGVRDVEIGVDGKMVWDIPTQPLGDFAGRPSPTAPPGRNPIDPIDVNDDGSLSPIDALLVINELNRIGAPLLSPLSGSQSPRTYFDVSGDNYVSPIDALWVINSLNGRSTDDSGSGLIGGDGDSSGSDGSDSGDSSGYVGGSGEGEASSRAGDHSVAAAQCDSESPIPAAPFIPVAGFLPLGALSGVARKKALEEALRLFAADVAEANRTSDLLGTDASLLATSRSRLR